MSIINCLREIDTKLFVKQKLYLTELSFKKTLDVEYAVGLLNLLDAVQDYCENQYNMDFENIEIENME